MLLRFPIKRLSTPKQEPQKKNVKKPVKETPRSQRAKQRMKQQDEGEEEEQEEDKEDVLSQSLRKRDKNIQENKAMVMNPNNLWCGAKYTF